MQVYALLNCHTCYRSMRAEVATSMLCRGSNVASTSIEENSGLVSGASAGTGPAAALEAASAGRAETVTATVLQHGQGAAEVTRLGIRSQSVSPIHDQHSCAQTLPLQHATLRPPGDLVTLPGPSPSSSIPAGPTEAAHLQAAPIHDVRQAAGQLAAALHSHASNQSGPLPGPPTRSSMPASHVDASSLQPGDGTRLTLQGPSLVGDVMGSSADAASGSRVDLCSSIGLDTASEALERRPWNVVHQPASQVGCTLMQPRHFTCVPKQLSSVMLDVCLL